VHACTRACVGVVRVVIAITLVVALDVDRASREKRAPPNSDSNSPIVHERIEIGGGSAPRSDACRIAADPRRRPSARLIRAARHVIHSILAQLAIARTPAGSARARAHASVYPKFRGPSSRESTARSARTSATGRGARWSEGGIAAGIRKSRSVVPCAKMMETQNYWEDSARSMQVKYEK